MVEEEIKKVLEMWNEFIKGGREAPILDSSIKSMPFKEEFNKKLKEYQESKEKRTLKECAALLKYWVDKKEAVRKALSSGPGEEVERAIASGNLEQEIEGSQELSSALNEIGIKNRFSEGKIIPAGRGSIIFKEGKILVVDEQAKRRLDDLEKREKEVATHIQILNAKRQIMELEEKQLEEYEKLQKEYLEISKEKSTLLGKLLRPDL